MGLMQASVADDYQIAGYDRGPGDLTYTPADGGTVFTVKLASFNELGTDEVHASGGLFRLGDRKWWLGADQFPVGRMPTQGDKLTDPDGVIWVIALESVLDPMGMAWTSHTAKAR
jgi:hypothetical protein